MAQLSDIELSETGLDAPSDPAGRVLILACGALAREILALIKLNDWGHMDLTCLPAKLHLYPEKITDAVADAVEKHRANYEQIFVAYADCGTGGMLASKCKELGVDMIAGPHCYSFFEGNDAFGKLEDEITAFYLTDFLVKQFDAFVWKPMGLDRHPELRDMYFGNYTKLVYQAQVNDPTLDRKAELIAQKMGLPLERRFTGYGDLSVALADVSRR
ncbi:hypothetical protein BFP76_06885 [Amylibacter kogurei]|uniref:DUF1638 domain-containing protein n=1 Tax=Paramylibacter kogurei TaxID=1889778 RepID=A0A2G5K7A0_9RHOB|nr:DUF1638 domain-containing protein [Amylibacter kogurei]PIB24883.1 hypothetical protein BFP76_06885 [Amylibacter kogurei]